MRERSLARIGAGSPSRVGRDRGRVQASELIGKIETAPDLKVVVFESANPDFFIAHWDVTEDGGKVLAMPNGPTGMRSPGLVVPSGEISQRDEEDRPYIEPTATCSIERSVEVPGERWTFLILRQAHGGTTRFADFRDDLGIAPDVLGARLEKLVSAGVMERREYQAPGECTRLDYHLT
jgi:DNA-binding HxlR family transcriptional regulator